VTGTERLLYDLKTAAALLSVSPSTLRSLVQRQEIRSVRLGDRVLFAPADLERYVTKLQKEAQVKKKTPPVVRPGGVEPGDTPMSGQVRPHPTTALVPPGRVGPTWQTTRPVVAYETTPLMKEHP
jgi:excisionase family DNA binding protein